MSDNPIGDSMRRKTKVVFTLFSVISLIMSIVSMSILYPLQASIVKFSFEVSFSLGMIVIVASVIQFSFFFNMFYKLARSIFNVETLPTPFELLIAYVEDLLEDDYEKSDKDKIIDLVKARRRTKKREERRRKMA